MASEFLVVAERVLERTKRPMSAREIVSFGMEEGWFSDNIAGRTPHQTMKSKLSQDIRRLAENSRFVRTRPGRFSLKSLLADESDVYKAPPYEKPVSRERVLAVPSEKFTTVVRFQGLNERWKGIHTRLLRHEKCVWIDRMVAEQDDAYKQVLTYVVVTRRGSVLSYKRGNYNRVEAYLRGSQCVGFGGHVSQADFLPMFPSPNMGLTECVVRELSEEIDLPSEDRHRLSTGDGLDCIGVLNDDSSAVGRRHFAFVFRYEVSTHPQWIEPIRGEKSITQLKWLNRHSDPIPIWEFEYWSQLVLRRFFPSVVTTQQSYKVVRRKPLTPPHLLCLIGEVGSGKSKTKEVLNTQFNYREVNSGRVLANLLKIPSVPDTPREDFQAKAWEFITSGDGPGRLAKAIARHVTELGHERVLIDGIRQRATLEELRRHCENRRLGILYVFTPPDMAYDFYRRRERQGITFEDYLAIRNADVETEVPGMIAIADGVLYNWTGHAFHVATIRSMFEELGIQ